MKRILFICLTLVLNACIVAPPYRPYGYGVNISQPYYYPNYHSPYYGNRYYPHYYNNWGNYRGGYNGHYHHH